MVRLNLHHCGEACTPCCNFDKETILDCYIAATKLCPDRNLHATRRSAGKLTNVPLIRYQAVVSRCGVNRQMATWMKYADDIISIAFDALNNGVICCDANYNMINILIGMWFRLYTKLAMLSITLRGTYLAYYSISDQQLIHINMYNYYSQITLELRTQFNGPITGYSVHMAVHWS